MNEPRKAEPVDELTLAYASQRIRRSKPGPGDERVIGVFKWLFRIAILVPFVAGAIWIAILLCAG